MKCEDDEWSFFLKEGGICVIKKELKALWENKLLFVVFIAILLIPTIYAGIFLASMWDPYGEVSNLPVAVVNEDKSVKYKGKTLQVGKDLAENLADNDSMAFNVVDTDTAQRGLINGTYYMVIRIPQDFSKNATTLMDKNPKKMELSYETNPGRNYVAMKMGESAMKEIKNNITSEVTKTYAQNVFDNLEKIGDGFDDAVDGTDKLIKGENKLAKGNKTISDNLDVLAKSSLTFKSGATKLKEGLVTYTNGVTVVDKGLGEVETGLKKVNNGVDQLLSGSNRLLKGLKTMQSSLNNSLTSKNVKQMQAAAQGLNTINNGLQQLNSQVQSGLSDDKIEALNGLASSLTGIGKNIQDAGSHLTTVGSKMTSAGSDLNGAASALVGSKYLSTGKDSDIDGAMKDNVTAQTYIKMAMAGKGADGSDLSEEQKAAYLSKALDSLNSSNSNIKAATSKVGSAGSDIKSAGTSLSSGASELTSAGNTLKKFAGSSASSAGLGDQLKALRSGVAQLASADAQAALTGSSRAITSLLSGMQTVQTGLNMTKASDGSSGLVEGMSTLNQGLTNLKATGTVPLQSGVSKLLHEGTNKLVSNNNVLLTGMSQLSTGATQISDGSSKLATGSKTVGSGIGTLKSGTKKLNKALADGSEEIKENKASDKTTDMFSEPVETTENQITIVENNGHAMAAYMMSVGLWVGTLAFCLIYPLTKYHGELKGGMAWWASKAVVIYPLAVLMAVILVSLLHSFLGFDPVNMKMTIVSAVVATVAFMSMMYFFNALLGKVGSFIMLVFMVLQLAGSAGTYPLQVSGPLANALHKYVPFTYSVEAFRSTISGGTSVSGYLTVLGVLAIVFTILTIILFEVRAKRIKENKPLIYTWIEEKGLA